MESRQPDAGARGGQEPNFDDLDALLGGMLQGGNMADMERHMQRMRQQMERMQQDLQQGQGQAQGGVQMQVFRLDQGRIQINDAQGSITIEKKDGKSTLTAKDKDGKVIFEGPYSTKEEKAIVPENIRKRTERFKIEDGNLAPPVLPGMPQPDEPKMDGHVAPGDRVD
jgi:preprotein translocase subunit YajC